MAATQLNRARTIKKVEKPRPLKLTQRHATVDGRITTSNTLLINLLISFTLSHFNLKYADLNAHFILLLTSFIMLDN